MTAINSSTGIPRIAVSMKKLGYPMASTIDPEYPPNNFGSKVISDVKIANCMAVNEMLVRLERKATNAALAIPADKLSAEITIYSQVMS